MDFGGLIVLGASYGPCLIGLDYSGLKVNRNGGFPPSCRKAYKFDILRCISGSHLGVTCYPLSPRFREEIIAIPDVGHTFLQLYNNHAQKRLSGMDRGFDLGRVD